MQLTPAEARGAGRAQQASCHISQLGPSCLNTGTPATSGRATRHQLPAQLMLRGLLPPT